MLERAETRLEDCFREMGSKGWRLIGHLDMKEQVYFLWEREASKLSDTGNAKDFEIEMRLRTRSIGKTDLAEQRSGKFLQRAFMRCTDAVPCRYYHTRNVATGR